MSVSSRTMLEMMSKIQHFYRTFT